MANRSPRHERRIAARWPPRRQCRVDAAETTVGAQPGSKDPDRRRNSDGRGDQAEHESRPVSPLATGTQHDEHEQIPEKMVAVPMH